MKLLNNTCESVIASVVCKQMLIIYPIVQKHHISSPSRNMYTSLFNNYMRPSQNVPLPPEYTPFFNNYDIMRHYLNLPPPLPEYTPYHFSATICDFPRIYSSLSKHTPPPFSTTICDPIRMYPSLSEYTVLDVNLAAIFE